MRRSQAIEYVKRQYGLTGWDAQTLWHIYWSMIMDWHSPNADEFVTTVSEYLGKADLSTIIVNKTLDEGYKKHLCVYILMMEGSWNGRA